jgi:pimeloyl-ACP methyl ester carboxylesterase
VVLAPAGGWARGDDSVHYTLDHFTSMHDALRGLAPHADAIVSTREGRRRATAFTTASFEHIPPELLAHHRLLPWPSTAARYLHDWLPHADWIVLDGVGHCPQLDVPLETAQLILGLTSP